MTMDLNGSEKLWNLSLMKMKIVKNLWWREGRISKNMVWDGVIWVDYHTCYKIYKSMEVDKNLN